MQHTAPLMTSDGTGVSVGLRVFTTNCRWGTVVETNPPGGWDGWFRVLEDGEPHPTDLNGERCAVRDNINYTRDPHPQEVHEFTVRIRRVNDDGRESFAREVLVEYLRERDQIPGWVVEVS